MKLIINLTHEMFVIIWSEEVLFIDSVLFEPEINRIILWYANINNSPTEIV
jgi:hypothetical protein